MNFPQELTLLILKHSSTMKLLLHFPNLINSYTIQNKSDIYICDNPIILNYVTSLTDKQIEECCRRDNLILFSKFMNVNNIKEYSIICCYFDSWKILSFLFQNYPLVDGLNYTSYCMLNNNLNVLRVCFENHLSIPTSTIAITYLKDYVDIVHLLTEYSQYYSLDITNRKWVWCPDGRKKFMGTFEMLIDACDNDCINVVEYHYSEFGPFSYDLTQVIYNERIKSFFLKQKNKII